jgi:hypothetical protein
LSNSPKLLLLIFILIHSIGQIFLSQYSLSGDSHFIFAQSPNATSIFVPSNMTKMEVVLRTDSGASDNSVMIQIITAASSAVGAILGGYLASRYAHKKAMDLEKLRYDQEKQRQDDIEKKKENEEQEYREKVTALVYTELTRCASTLKNIMDKEGWMNMKDIDFQKIAKGTLGEYGLEFPKFPFDIKLSIFKTEVLFQVQFAYLYFENFRKNFILLVEEFGNNSEEMFEAVQKIEPHAAKHQVDLAITKLKEILPPNIVNKSTSS